MIRNGHGDAGGEGAADVPAENNAPADFNQGQNQNFNQGPNQNFNQGPNQNFNQGPNQNFNQGPNQNFNQGPNQGGRYMRPRMLTSYFDKFKEIPLDQWGNSYRYEWPTNKGDGTKPAIWSPGPGPASS